MNVTVIIRYQGAKVVMETPQMGMFCAETAISKREIIYEQKEAHASCQSAVRGRK
jgi:hypothetical protein